LLGFRGAHGCLKPAYHNFNISLGNEKGEGADWIERPRPEKLLPDNGVVLPGDIIRYFTASPVTVTFDSLSGPFR